MIGKQEVIEVEHDPFLKYEVLMREGKVSQHARMILNVWVCPVGGSLLMVVALSQRHGSCSYSVLLRVSPHFFSSTGYWRS